MNPATPAPPSALAVGLALASVYLVWGSTYLAIRYGLEGYPPFLMGSLRFIAASLVFYAFLRWRGHAPPTRAQWKNAAVMGLFMMLLGNGLVNFAEQTVSSGLAAVAVASMPLWAGLFGVMRGQHPSRGEWLGLAIGFVGVVWLNLGGEMRASVGGMLALLLAPIAWAFGSVWSRGRDLPAPFMSTAAQMLCGGVAMGVLGLLLGERITETPPLSATLAVGYLAAFGSIIGFSAYVWLLHHVRPALATSYAYVNPPIAVLLGALLLDERVGWGAIGAMAVILGGVLIITRAKARGA
ncbi:drug/metabolite exporter YedA [Arenimonas caeni]|jgi:drug/metabolite transporter (DMT)-like permease|uniref:drug/metabolite exporter YedA n=1 Tax=Arenimonas caeni TaxID=2058085 RepID=UPI002A35C829|nr:drug/metabolite exporter YedA [Arenimonas caeni]MDY0021744.1 drug/metabolite exporter YedA [Arenimonas caeni]